MKHNIILKALRCLAAAGLCLAAAACSKDDIMPVDPPQEGITPTQIIFNATRGGYEGDAETRAPNGRGKATYTNGEWVVTITDRFIRNSVTLYGRYAEKATAGEYDNLYMEQPGELACTTSGSYEVGENGITTITLTLDEHPQGRMTFTGVEPGKELTVLGMNYAYQFPSTWLRPWFKTAPLTLTGEADGTATLYALPNIVTEGSTTLTVEYDGTLYTKTFAGKEFKANSNITLAAPSLEGGWAEAVTEYEAADLKMGDVQRRHDERRRPAQAFHRRYVRDHARGDRSGGGQNGYRHRVPCRSARHGCLGLHEAPQRRRPDPRGRDARLCRGHHRCTQQL